MGRICVASASRHRSGPGPWAVSCVFRRWVQRNPTVSASILALLVGLASSLWILHLRNTALDDVRELADQTAINILTKRAHGLWPVHPDLVPRCDAWLKEAEPIVARRAIHRAALDTHRDRAVAASREVRRIRHPGRARRIDRLSQEVDALELSVPLGIADQASVDARRQELADAERLLLEGAEFDYPDNGDRWIAENLRNLTEGYSAFEGLVDDVRKRRARSEVIAEETLERHAELWAQCRRAIKASPLYHGLDLPLQIGLVPLHEDPDSKLWEFWLVESGDRPERDTLERHWRITGDTGIVLVLLPGGEFLMGASRDPEVERRNLDPAAEPDEGPVRLVALSPFFISKFEITQGQWLAWTESNPSEYKAGHPTHGEFVSLCNPVTNITWVESESVLTRFGLTHPTEAQWEFSSRAGSQGPRFQSAEGALDRYMNIADAGSRDLLPEAWALEPGLNDGFPIHAPVGSFKPNAFGLHDTLGNVWEWCSDWHTWPYDSSVTTDPTGPKAGIRKVLRGGAFTYRAIVARNANRHIMQPSLLGHAVGIRPTMAIRSRSDSD